MEQADKNVMPNSPAHPPRAMNVRCTSCNKKLRVDETWLGKTVKCPICQSAFVALPSGPRKQARETILADPRVLRPEHGPGADPHGPVPAAEIPPEPHYPAAAESLPNGGWPGASRPAEPGHPPHPRAAAPPRPGGAGAAARPPAPPRGALTTFRIAQQESEEGSGRGLPPLKFAVVVLNDPEQALQGRCDAELTQQGLALRQGKASALVIPVGSPAEYLGSNCFTVIVGHRRVEMILVKRRANQQRLTEDVVAFLNGEKKWLYTHNYTLPWYLYAPALLPVGIPLVAIPKQVLVGGVGGMVLWSAVAVVLSAGCLLITRKEKWALDTRIIRALALSAVGYIALVVAILVGSFVLAGDLGTLKAFTSKEGQFAVALPDTPKENTRSVKLTATEELTLHEFQVALKKPAIRFTVFYLDLSRPRTDAKALFDELHSANLAGLSGIKSVHEQERRLEGHAGREYTLELFDGRHVIQRLFLVKKRVYYVIVDGARLGEYSQKVNEFFDSFKLEQPPPKPDNDLRFAAKIDTFLTAVADPGGKFALVSRYNPNDRTMEIRRYSCPGFHIEGSCPLERPAYQLAFDATNSCLYAAVSDPKVLQERVPLFARHKGIGRGDLLVYNWNEVDQKIKDAESPRPAPTVLVQDVKVANLLLSPDGDWLYYLNVKDPQKVQVGRINTETRKQDPDLLLAEGTMAMCLSQDGKTLYAIASSRQAVGKSKGTIQLIDTDRMTLRDSFTVEADPYDLDVNSDGLLFLSGGSNAPALTVVDTQLKKIVAPVVGNVERCCFIKLARDQRRVYLANHPDSKQTHSIKAWNIPEAIEEGLQWAKEVKATDEYPQMSGPLILTPDGKYLFAGERTILELQSAGER
jgi:hypothetical protein